MDTTKTFIEDNPKQRANFLSILLNCWIISFLIKGYRKALNSDDLFRPLDDDKSQVLGDELQRNWISQSGNSKKRSLLKAIVKTFWKQYLLLLVLDIITCVVVRVLKGLFLGKMMLYFRYTPEISYHEAVYYGLGLLFADVIQTLTYNHHTFQSFHIGMKVRVAICSLIYRKSLTLSRTSLSGTSTGKLVNLLSNDVNRFDYASLFIWRLVTGPLLTICVCWFIWAEIGVLGFIGIGVLLGSALAQSLLGKLISKYRLQTAGHTDNRIRLIDELISGVQVVKMYAWEIPFSKLIAESRRLEASVIRKTNFLRGAFMIFWLVIHRFALFCAIMGIVYISKDSLHASTVFVLASYYESVATVMSKYFARCITELSEALVSIKRLQTFLQHDEKPQESITYQNIEQSVLIEAGCAKWNLSGTQLTLNDINLSVKQGQLVGVIGAVGSGKSSLLQVLLRELPLTDGVLVTNGNFAYTSQEPWIFTGSVKANILFGQEMDEDRYAETVKVCALLKDFDQLPYGDRTIVGERGISLSGGQKARVSLARAVYRKADIYLLDDPLSAVDAHVGAHLFDQCIGSNGFLGQQRATRILVTHQIHFLLSADHLIVLKEGRIERQGLPYDILRDGVDFDISAMEVKPEESPSPRNAIPPLQLANNPAKGEPKMNIEEFSKTKVKGSLLWEYVKAGTNSYAAVSVFVIFILAQAIATFNDWWVSHWTAEEELRSNLSHVSTLGTHDGIEFNIVSLPLNGTDHDSSLTGQDWYARVYGAVMGCLIVAGFVRTAVYVQIMFKSSQKLHDGMFMGIVKAPMRFFDTNPSGRVLNRFSKDLGLIDDQFSKALFDSAQILFNLVGGVVLCAILNPIFLAPVIVLGVILFCVRQLYLRTSISLRRLDAITRSPVFVHLSASINGLSTIRSFATQELLIQEFDSLQDGHSSSWFMLISANGALSFMLDVICTLFLFSVLLYFFLSPESTRGAIVGVVITQISSIMSDLQFGVRQSTEVSTQLTAVERGVEYRDLDPEPEPEVPQATPDKWPVLGRIQFKDVSYRYYDGGNYVLKGLNFNVDSTAKIGIVGRTGAGKSSLIGVLFRMALVNGEVSIDGVDTSTISLKELRSKISIIPQDPILFSGTIKRNLDPFEEFAESDIWNALKLVELARIAGGPLGLNTLVAAGGTNFSVGERQLLCLARAILRKNKILVLDEATANVDPDTDKLIQQTIRARFAQCTVLTVAHRLNTIIDSDKVLVVDAGEIVEFGPPDEMLERGGVFKEMVDATGPAEAENLFRIAKKEK